MGSYVGAFQFRDVVHMPAASAALNHNIIHTSIVGSGMVKVPDADFPGQAGTFTGSATPAAGETSVTELTGGAFEFKVDGFKVYKHPTLALWVKVNFISVRYDWGSRFLTYGFQFSTEMAAGSLTPARTSPMIYPFAQVYGGNVSTRAVGTGVVDLLVNCGADNFWIHAPGQMGLAQTSNNYTPVGGSGSMLSIGIFENSGNYGVVSTCLYVGQAASNYGPSLTGSIGPQGSRYWTYDGGSWAEAAQCSFGQLLDPAVTTVAGNTRVARASKVIAGVRRSFKFGFISGLGAVEKDTLSIDLDGTGAKNYRVCTSMGPSSPMSYNYTTGQYSVPILPWGH